MSLPQNTPQTADDRLVEWFRYFQDIRLDRFYLDRQPSTLAAQMAENPQVAQLPQHANVSVASIPSRMAPSSNDFMRARKPASVPPAQGPVISGFRSASLFEGGDRLQDDSLEKIRADIGDCTRCRLCEQRTNIVFGVGNSKAELVFVGEGPGRDEDIQGIPFVGRAGQLLTQMIEAMGLKREQVYIANVVKCRPPENRTPEKDECATCSPFLMRQLDVIQPKVIVCLGNVAMQTLLATNRSMSSVRGQWFPFRGAKLLPTYHPAYLLRNPPAKADVWTDLKKVMVELGLPLPSPSKTNQNR
jgi:uracil-DNA glycosylase